MLTLGGIRGKPFSLIFQAEIIMTIYGHLNRRPVCQP